MKTILVIRSSAMGDVVMTAPVIAELLSQYHNVKVLMLSRDFFSPFFQKNERFELYNFELYDRHAGVSGIYKLYKELKSAYKIDLVVDLHSKLYSRLLCLFFKMGGTRCYEMDKGRAEKKALTREKNKSKVQLRTSVCRYIDAFGAAGFPLTVHDTLKVVERRIPPIFGSKNSRWIGISPFAQHQGKRLPIATIENVIAQSCSDDRIFLFGGGQQEADVAAELEAKFSNVTSVIGKIKLAQEIDLIANLDVMLSMDSSAMHIASLVGVRVVSVWGATHPFAGFLGQGQSLDDVVQIESLECRPCSVYGNKPCYRGDYACLNQITAEMITSVLYR